MFGKRSKLEDRNEALLRRLDKREVRYITRRNSSDYGETIIGRDGVINIHEEELIIICDNNIVFRQPLKLLDGGELMSLDGINLRSKDEKTGSIDTVVAYYKYYRK